MERKESHSVDLFFDSSYGMDIKVYRSPNKTENQIGSSGSHAVLEQVKEGDVFTYEVSKDGHYSEHIAFALTKRDVELGEKHIEVRPLSPIGGRGYEPKVVFRWPDEIERNYFGIETLTNVDRTILDTPAFSAEKAAHEFTHHEEVVNYLQENLGENGHLYYLDEDKTLPVVIFTCADLSKPSAALEDVLKQLRTDGKLKIFYQAQIHGNEPAAGEGALTVAKTLGTGGRDCLKNVDIVMVPRANYEGAKGYLRGCEGLDLNRDSLRQASVVTRRLHWLCNQLAPEVFIDGHEFNGQKQFAQERDGKNVLAGLDDLQLVSVNNLNRFPGIFEEEQEILRTTIEELNRKGFRTVMFKPSTDGRTSCGFARLHNCLTFLVESCGMWLGKNHLERRVLSQHEAVMSIISQVSSKSEKYKELVGEARTVLALAGKTYSDRNYFVLRHSLSESTAVELIRLDYGYDGKIFGDEEKKVSYENFGQAEKKRTRPTAYVISKKSAFAQAVKDILDEHEIEYFLTENQARIPVRQYSGTGEEASLGRERRISFSEGAYVVCMNQEKANVISTLFEPDTANGKESESLVQMGIVGLNEKNRFPLFRTEISEPQKKLR